MNACQCGCGARVRGQWSKGHNRRGVPPTNKIGFTESNGYRFIYSPDRGQKHAYAAEHRLVAERAILGRALNPGEVVHHKNGLRTDNRPENLEVLQKREHDRHHVKVADACSVCNGPHRARGLCSAHYGRFYRAGLPMPLEASRGSRWSKS